MAIGKTGVVEGNLHHDAFSTPTVIMDSLIRDIQWEFGIALGIEASLSWGKSWLPVGKIPGDPQASLDQSLSVWLDFFITAFAKPQGANPFV